MSNQRSLGRLGFSGGRRIAARTPPNHISGLTYNAAGQLTADTLGNGVTESYGYDANRLQLTSQTAGSGGALLNMHYSYQAAAGQMGAGTTAGNADQLMAINNSSINGVAGSASYTYDLERRLVTSSLTDKQRRFAYDRWGNRTGMWDAASGGNQLQSITLQQSGGAPTNQIQSVTTSGSVNYTYDAAGNVTSDGVHTYEYDGESRIKTVDSGSTSGQAYDYQNRRVRKTVGSAVTHYIWDGSQVIAEHNAK
jgi:YD repeat-containing protein